MVAMRDTLSRARSRLDGEFFVMIDPDAERLARAAWQDRQLPGAALIAAHPQSIAQLDPLVLAPTSAWGGYGLLAPSTTPRQYIHTKTLAIDGDAPDRARAIISTGSISPGTFGRFELAGIVNGADAQAVSHLARSAAGSDLAYMRRAIDMARERGVFVNDPVTGQMYLTHATDEFVATEDRRLVVGVKSAFDTEFARALAARRASGVDVSVVTERMDEPTWRILHDSGTPMLKPDPSKPEMHGNFLLGTGRRQAQWGTAYASPRTFGRTDVPSLYAGGGATLSASEQWARSREMGAITDDPGAYTTMWQGFEELNAQPHDFSGELVRPGPVRQGTGA